MTRYSVYDVVNDTVVGIVTYGMRENPYAVPKPVEVGTMTIADIVDVVRRRHGEKAADSVRFTVH
ncbi:hypothetical protein ABIA99_005261 [Bradyrhizobium sp. LB12.1]|uniref:hypothetical protein n=1 Tax=Bradyrhizobium sp. LB12.1 TaxID=3156327 RepID=UPI0033955F7F